FRMPDNKLSLAAGFNDDRWTITRLPRRQRSPQFFARILVKSHDQAAFSPNQADELFAVDKRMGGKPPDLHGRLVILGQILGPNHFAVSDVQTKQVAHGAQGVDFAVLNHGRGPRSGWV